MADLLDPGIDRSADVSTAIRAAEEPSRPAPPFRRSPASSPAALAASLAVLAVAAALLAQFGITRGSPIRYPAYGFVLAVALFAASAYVGTRGRAAVLPAPVTPPRALALPLRWELIGLAAVVGGALFFRFYHFSSFPPGIWYDEAINGTDALSIIDKDHLTVWRTSNFGHSTIYFYLLVLSFKTFGYTVFAFRIVPALAGLATVVAFYFLARWLLGPVPALVTTALLAVSRYAVTFSRISWEASLQPLFEILAVYFLVRALETRRRLFFVLAGASLAAGLYTYLGFRFVPVEVAFIVLYIAIAERRLLLRNIPGLAVYAVSFLVVVLPLAQYGVRHQEAVLARTKDINVFKEISRQDSLQPLKDNLEASLEMMNAHGDENGRHNLPGAPMLDEVSGALFVLGLAVCAWSIRDWRRASMAGWFALALVPGALTISTENPSAIRGVGAIPPMFLIVGLAVAVLYRTLLRVPYGAALFAASALALVGGGAALNYHQLFDLQAHSQQVYDGFIPVYTDVAKLAAAEADHNDVYITPEFYAQPVVRVLTHGKVTHVYNPSARALPANGRDAVLIIDARDFAIIPTLERLYPHLTRTDDVDPYGRTYFTVVRIPASDLDARQRLRPTESLTTG